MVKQMLRFGLALALALGVISMDVVQAQQGPGSLVTITGQRGDAALRCDTVTSAGAAAATVTMTNPGPGLSNYVTAVGTFGIVSAATATAAAATMPTLTGFNGTSASVGWPIASGGGTVATLSLGAVTGGWFVPATPVKTNANVAASVVGGTAITGAQQAVTVCYYPSP